LANPALETTEFGEVRYCFLANNADGKVATSCLSIFEVSVSIAANMY